MTRRVLRALSTLGIAVLSLGLAAESGLASAKPTTTTTTTKVSGPSVPSVPDKVQAVQKVKDGYQYLKSNYSTTVTGVARYQALATVKADIGTGKLVIHLPTGARLAAGNAKVLSGKDGTLVILHILGGGLMAESAFVVQLGAHDAVTYTVETHWQALGHDSGRITQWRNGSLALDKIVTGGGQVSNPHTPATAADSVKPLARSANHHADYWDDVANCLTNQGVPGWVINSIWVACGVVCALTAGGGCLACAAGVAALWANQLATCIGA
ncbi:MAG TPA: hypothetical protein VFN97_07055 [Actinospica sp.]|nr:hypothetical protein [Actinospica sp.]